MIHLRSEWTTRAAPWQPPRRDVPDVFVHHEGGAVRGVPADKPAVLREIESGVLGKGYIAIDYNLMVFADGDIWEGRGLAHEDGATINNNATSVSVCAVGNYEKEPAPDALVHGIATAVQAAAQSGWATGHPNVRAHREVFQTACPGSNLFARMGEIRALAAGTPQPVPEDDLTPEQAIQLQAIYDALVTDPATKKPRSIADRLGWNGNWIKSGGYDARSDGKPSRIEEILAGVNKLLAKP